MIRPLTLLTCQRFNLSSNNNLSTKVLVTGGTGFLGAYIIRELIEKGYTVRALRRSAKLPGFISPDILNKAEWVNGDVLDIDLLEEAMQGVDAVVHSAAVVSFSKKDKKNMYQVNAEGTANVVNLALEQNIKRLVHISSVAALGRTAGEAHVNEEKRWEESRVNTHYARSKQKAELEVWRAMSEGLNGVILNPSTILGYGDWNNSSCAIFKRIYDGFNYYTSGINGFVDVEDVARVTQIMLRSDITEQQFIVNGDTWAFRRLQETIAEGFHKKKPQKEATPFLLGIAWRAEKIRSLFTGKRPLLTKESAKVAVSKTWFENEKLLKALPGFSFTPLEETIRKACEKYLAPAR